MASIQGIYIALFGRPADPTGLEFFSEATGNGADLTAIGDLASTAEYQSRFEGMDNAAIVTEIYQSLFGRNPEQGGLTFFVNALASGSLSINNIAIAILDGAQGDDLTMVTNKITAADAFTAALDTPDEVAAYRGDDAAGAGRNFLTGITADATTVPTAEETAAAVKAVVDLDTTPADQTFVLTTLNDLADVNGAIRNAGAGDGIESPFRFSSANQTVMASGTTLTANDSLIDSTTTDEDVLRLALTQTTAAATVQGIENLNVTATNSAAATIDLTNFSGIHDVTITGTPSAGVVLANAANHGIETVNASGLTSVGGTFTVDFTGQNSAVTVTGGSAGDTITGGNGSDTLSGGAGDDAIAAGAGDDTVNGGDGADTLYGENGNDTVNGGAGADTVSGGAGNDTLLGGGGADTIDAGTGDDVITGGGGDDSIALVTGVDTVKFEATAGDNGNDTITDFAVSGATGADKLDFSAFLDGAASITIIDPNDAAADNVSGDNVVIFNDAFGTDTDTIVYASNDSFVLITDEGANSNVYYVTTDVNGVIATSDQVAELTGLADPTTLTASNFI